jgi:hypothetical protein
MKVLHCLMKCWWMFLLPLVLAITLFALAASTVITGTVHPLFKAYQPSRADEFADLLISSAGWLLAVAVLLLTGQGALHGLMFQALLKLHEDEGAPEQKKAKGLVWKARPPRDYSGNIYGYVREYVAGLPDKEREELDWARHRMTHFWYRAARLVDVGVLDFDGIRASVGPPDILTVLEPLEAIKAESIDPGWEPRPWPPMKLLIAWYKHEGRKNEAKQVRSEVPARPDLYRASRADSAGENILCKETDLDK